MLFGGPRTILILSPQPWTGIEVSKHHYAKELAALGHRVVFVEPPVFEAKAPRLLVARSDTPGVEVAAYRPGFPYALKFHARPVFDRLMTGVARSITTAVGRAPDIVWDFDNTYTFGDLTAFRSGLSVFHPVDDIEVRTNGDKRADLVLSVAQRFLDKVTPKRAPMHVVPHGLGRAYEVRAREVVASPAARPREGRALSVGIVGNLDRVDIDWTAMARMVSDNPGVMFAMIGPVTPGDMRVRAGGEAFARVRASANVTFEGRLSAGEVIARGADIDVWLLAYDPQRSANAATDSHKLLEYLATGSPVVSHRVEAYVGRDLIAMPQSQSNTELPAVLARAIAALDRLNAPQMRARRAAFALEHTYAAQVRRVSDYFDQAAPGLRSRSAS